MFRFPKNDCRGVHSIENLVCVVQSHHLFVSIRNLLSGDSKTSDKAVFPIGGNGTGICHGFGDVLAQYQVARLFRGVLCIAYQIPQVVLRS